MPAAHMDLRSVYGCGVLSFRSGTHECRPKALHQPETLEELESLVADYHKRGESCAARYSCLREVLSAILPY